MSFDVGADAYGQFMGRFSEPLATEFIALLDRRPGQRILDVGCGPGALTAALVTLFGADSVSAVDPSESFVAAIRARFPNVDVRCAGAEQLPFADETFDTAAAQLVVHFMSDPVAGLSEMARVTRRDGLIAASVWDHAGGGGPLSLFWRAVRDLDPEARDESGLAGAAEGHLAELFDQAGLHDLESGLLTVRVDFATLDDWWQPFTFGVGPAGAYVVSLDEEHRHELRTHCTALLPHAPFQVSASAWFALGRA